MSGFPIPDLTEVPGAKYSARLPMALAYAAVMHATDVRKDDISTPYITHPMAVASLVWHYGLRVSGLEPDMEDLVIAGILHDVAEDAGGGDRLLEINAMFGDRVSEVVSAATDSLVADPQDKAPWRERKEAHIERVRDLSAVVDGYMNDPGACLVIACDKLHNLTGTAAAVEAGGDDFMNRFQGGPAGTRWYFQTMFEALKPGLPDQLILDFSAQLARLGNSAG